MAERPQLSIVNYRQGMYIVLEGNRDAERFFIIQRGTVQLTKDGIPVQQESSSVLNAGDFFGVVAAMAQKSQLETAQAVTDVTLVATNCAQFEGLIQFNTPIAMKIIQQFSRRMRYLNNELTKLTLHSIGSGNDAGALFAVAEHYFKQAKFRIAIYAYKRFIQCYPQDPRVADVDGKIRSLVQHDKPNYRGGSTPFIRHYSTDCPVFIEGESGDELFIIQSGAVKITKVINNDEVILALLKPGDIFGEMSILESKARSASAIAFEETTLMVVQKQNFEGMAATQPQVIARLTRLLAERIWFSYKQLENALIKDHVGRCFDYLLIQLERANFPVTTRASYTFNFGLEELAKMASIPENEIRLISRKLLENNRLSLLGDGKIIVPDVTELVKLSEYYKKAQARGGVRK
ncbi:MAG: Crp/Fnr family transcriptional regulator [Spirochaetaceae bacterium]|jgi:CRP-like cAMP-binding protein|nr:Crp/Fnr family transcriptional regulator [Spirochaetaceae bacterium]